jgi:hypothetical protein
VGRGHVDYSGTPLAKKLGIKEGARVLIVNPPPGLSLGALPGGVELLERAGRSMDVVLLFGTRGSDLSRRFGALAGKLAQSGRLWICWPKKAARMDTDVTFEVAQSIGLDAGLVDNKSASITDAYQGLQFVIRLRDRPS